MKKRTVAVLCAAAAVLGVIIGGTMAYLQHSATVVNTFTAGRIGITLTETDQNGKPVSDQNYIMAPGVDLRKDPKVTVDANSEDCYLFVKVTEKNITDRTTPITWEIADSDKPDGWKKVENAAGLGTGESVYYRVYKKGSETREFSVLKDDKVTVPNTVTQSQMNSYKDNHPQLTFTAYAIQKDWLTKDDDGTQVEITDPAEIWNLVKDAQPAAQNA